MLLLLVMFAVMIIPMLLMSNRQRKMMRQQQEMLSTLGIGDEVRTHSGFYGLIVDQYDDVVILETESGAQVKWAKAAISAKVDPAEGGTDAGADHGAHADSDGIDEAAGAETRSSETTLEDRRAGDVPGVTVDDERSAR